jgi:hypothetical protein
MSFELMEKIAEYQKEGLIDADVSPEDLVKQAGLLDVLKSISQKAVGVGKSTLDTAVDAVKAPIKWINEPQVTVMKKTGPKGEVLDKTTTTAHSNVAGALRKSMALGTGLGTGLAVAEGIGQMPSMMRRKKSLQSVLESTEIPRDQKKQARRIFEIMDTYAPSLAENPLVAQSFVKGVLEYGGVLDHRTISELINAERGMMDTRPGMVDKIHTSAKVISTASGIGVGG